MSSGFGMQPEFHNSAPRTREERQAALNKDALEKNRLKARAGPHHKPEECGNPLVPEPCSPLYADESSRFARDVAGEMRQQKLAELAKKEAMYERRRDENASKEHQRWLEIEQQQRAEAERLEHARAVGLRGKQNKSSEHFNIISLNYHDTKEGHVLQFKDDVTRYRAVLRAENLYNRAHSVPHNIITGEARHNPVKVPIAPAVPSDLR